MNPQILTLFGDVPRSAQKAAKARGKAKGTDEGGDAKPKKKRTVEQEVNILEGWKAEKHYYTIGEVAALFGVNNSNIRFWTTEFNLKVRTTQKGDRLYTPEQIEELHLIYNLVKQKGYTIAGAKVKLKEEKKKLTDAMQLRQSLLKLRGQLDIIRKQLG